MGTRCSSPSVLRARKSGSKPTFPLPGVQARHLAGHRPGLTSERPTPISHWPKCLGARYTRGPRDMWHLFPNVRTLTGCNCRCPCQAVRPLPRKVDSTIYLSTTTYAPGSAVHVTHRPLRCAHCGPAFGRGRCNRRIAVHTKPVTRLRRCPVDAAHGLWSESSFLALHNDERAA